MTRLETILDEFDQMNRQDSRAQIFEGVSHPREWIFAQRVSAWIGRLDTKSSEAVDLAARSHTICRWEIPRNRYAADTPGYHEWRAATAKHSAQIAADILKRYDYTDTEIHRVSQLITREVSPTDPDAQLLEDADCLAFLELKLSGYLSQWDETKLMRILRGTWSKMSPAARRLAGGLSYPKEAKKFLDALTES